MSRTRFFLHVGIFAVLAVFWTQLPQARAEESEKEIGLTERTGLSLAVYNADLALVGDRRRVALGKGINRLAFVDVSGQLRPETAVLSAAASGATFNVVEQNFEFDQLSQTTLLRRAIGRKIRIIRTHPTTGEESEVEATVLSAAKGVVLRIGDRIETGIPGRIAFESLPPGLRPRPTLVAVVDAESAATKPVELRYLTNGLRWQADYIAELNAAETQLDLRVLATLVNTSGADYTDAKLRLVAGDVNVAAPGIHPQKRMAALAEMAASPAPGIGMQKVSDFHVFQVARPVTLTNNQSKQIALMGARAVPVEKEYRLDNAVSTRRLPRPSKPGVGIWLKFRNRADAGLGQPLPRGTVRVYKRQAKDAPLFLGEDRVGHTPKNEELRVDLGRAFDLTAERKQMAFAREGLDKKVFESAFEITLKNGGAKPATVTVIERIPGDWTMKSESHPHKKTSAAQAEWRIEVPPAGEAKLIYRVRSHL